MKSQISRESHRPKKRYSGVYHIQGGMVTDADLDERSRIDKDRTDNLANDAIRDGVPVKGGGVALGTDNALSLREGVVYADGVRGFVKASGRFNQSQALSLFGKQADFPSGGPALPTNGKHIVYVDIWERPVYPLEDPYLADAGLHGAVTALRTRTMAQLKTAPAEKADAIDAGTGDFPQIGTASLAVEALDAEILANDCDPCADVVSVEQNVANALWRLEVIDVSGTPTDPGTITLAWSIENAAVIAPRSVDHNEFERAGKVYEYFSEITESHLGVFANAADAKRSAFVDDLATPPVPENNHDGKAWPWLRRWDGHAVIDIDGSDVSESLGSGFAITISDSEITLRVGAFEAKLDVTGAAVVAGDYWLVELRRHPSKAADRVRLVSAEPFGVLHHYCTLFRIDNGAPVAPTDAEVRKLSFPAMSDLPASHVAFDNKCEKLYDQAENVQEALDKLCDISAEDIAFESKCPELYDNVNDVQAALDALCKVDFSHQGAFRVLFDWGVACGLVGSLERVETGRIKISSGSFLDRSGQVSSYGGDTINLDDFKLRNEILFNTSAQLNAALQNDEACLALAAGDGGEVTVHVVPKSVAFGPDDPGFAERYTKCIKKKILIDLPGKIEELPLRERAVAEKILRTSSSGGALIGSAKLTEEEAELAQSFNDKLINEFESKANNEEKKVYKARIVKAKKDNPIGNLQGVQRQIRQMQRAIALFDSFLISDDERIRRCLCETLFPTCPPALGGRPYFVPIACLRGRFRGGQFELTDVCNYCCRKQAMTWRSVQYFLGDRREKLASDLADHCCKVEDEKPPWFDPGLLYDPDKLGDLHIGRVALHNDWVNRFFDQPKRSVTDFEARIDINDLAEKDAIKTLIGSGVEPVKKFDIDDPNTFDEIEKNSRGISASDQLISAGKVKPGDKVGLLLQDGIARGYVLLEKGSGKQLFEPTTLDIAASVDDLNVAKGLIDATKAAKAELGQLAEQRNELTTDVDGLRASVEALVTEREAAMDSLKGVQDALAAAAETRGTIEREITNINKELREAEANRARVAKAVRESQPVTAVTGVDKPEVLAAFASVGLTNMRELSKASEAKLNQLVATGAMNKTTAKRFKKAATTFLARNG